MRLFFTPQTDSIIDNYITQRQLPDSPDDCTSMFDGLLEQIVVTERVASNDQRQGIVKDIDALFRADGLLNVYAEIKYNDDHDTGKFADITVSSSRRGPGLRFA